MVERETQLETLSNGALDPRWESSGRLFSLDSLLRKGY